MPSILTLSDLRGITNAFDDFVSVAESDLPEYYKDIFPKQCKCGGEIIMTSTSSQYGGYTQLQCANPDCWIKMAHKFAYFAKSLGYKGFGAAGAKTLFEAVYREFEYPCFLNVFKLPDSRIDAVMGAAYADMFAAFKNDLQTRGFQFKDAVAALGIAAVGKGSNIFDIIKDPVVLLDYVLKNRIDEICDIAGIHALSTRYSLKIARIDIVTLMADIMPHIYSTPKKEVYVAITGAVSIGGQSLTRAEFIARCEALKDASGVQAYKIVETKAESKLDYVIADSPSGSSKYSLGARLKILITADNFYQLLQQTLDGGRTDAEQ